MSYQPHNHYQHQGLQQQPDLPQSGFPSYPMPLEQSAYPHQLSAAEPSNKDFLGHFNPVSFETISLAQDHSMASSFDSEEVPQGWLWDAYQRAAMDSMLLDRTRQEQEQQHCLPLVHTPGLSSSHSTALPSGLYAGDTFWHSNALELASRAAALASAPLMTAKQDAGITAPTPPAPTFVRLPPSMFQCPMEKCPKSFARAYNLHVHLKTQHHLASKELAAVSPLRAPPSAPPFQIITPEEVAAGTAMSDKEQPSAVQSGSKATNTTTSLTQSNLLSTSADNTTNNNDGDNINHINNNNNNNNGGNGSKPYLCTNCHKAFARTDALCRHYKVEDDCRQVLMEVETASTVAVTESKERVAH
ncbi:hypothetical protein KI688_004312 [Linnemannia hyalina]|uniref:C2H2-type domain-containing protein n=1 Tax=Linnemannia hyalina TaxID=64524 RepID=A0A9P8BP31_9FUNG|nr:hypothetical protein KI688_004312 [Linnemannia hyalina]